MKTIRVVAAVIESDGKIFATARGYGEYKGKWEFPGGKIEPGETPEEALKREIREELATEISVGERLHTVEYDYPEFHLSMDCFWCKVVAGELELLEAEAAKWLSPDDLSSVDWLPADLEVVEKIQMARQNHFMKDRKEKFYEWMLQHEKTTQDGEPYAKKSVENCVSTLNTALCKFEIVYKNNSDNTLFFCDNYSDFLTLDNQIRSNPKFEELDGPGKGQRWIHNGLLLYGNFLLECEGRDEMMRDDPLESVVIFGKGDGRKIHYYTTRYERSVKNRNKAIALHGLTCQCCGFNFQEKYGDIGKDFIEVHHIKPLFSINQEMEVNAQTDLVCLCSNCHRMIHRKKNEILTVEELRSKILA